jgi:hypothetical protein
MNPMSEKQTSSARWLDWSESNEGRDIAFNAWKEQESYYEPVVEQLTRMTKAYRIANHSLLSLLKRCAEAGVLDMPLQREIEDFLRVLKDLKDKDIPALQSKPRNQE